MQGTALSELDPASLPVGAQVGPWRVKGWAGRGTYGAVYRAVRVDCEEAGWVALKFAVHPEDPRYEREVKLLARLHHPNIPRYLAHGHLRRPSGAVHPYVAMQWVQGVPLYDWAAQRNPSSRQVLRVLAQAARALEAVHAARAVHRDVKGDNVLVRCGDGRVFLTDFGSANYAGASRLTPQPWPPGTPAYRSPEAWRFIQRFGPEATTRYPAAPADDLFALGVMAYRLVTDEYPPSTEPQKGIEDVWQEGRGGPRPPVALNPRVAPHLNDLILQMLAVRPEVRGTAAELANSLEEAADWERLEADHPLFSWDTQQRPRRRDRQVVRLAELRDSTEKVDLERREMQELARASTCTERDPARAPSLSQRLRLIGLAVGAVVLMMSRQVEPWQASVPLAAAEKGAQPTVALGDDGLPAATVASSPASASKTIGVDLPARPLDGQRRPPCAKGEVEIRGGCWGELKLRPPNCLERSYEWRGGCYMPIMLTPPPANSDQP